MVETSEPETVQDAAPQRMKDILDEGGDFYNLHKLVFGDLIPDMPPVWTARSFEKP